MTGSGDRGYDDALSSIRNGAEDLAVALAIWEARDDTSADARARHAASGAVDAIDAMLRALHAIRGHLIAEIRASDDATEPRALPDPTARVFFQGGSGGVTTASPDGFMGQSWWANWGNPAVVHLNSQTSEFTVTIQVDPSQFSDWNGEQGANSPALFNDTASHVRQIGLSFRVNTR